MLGLLSLAIVAAIALVGCSEAPNKGPCPSGYVESGNWRVDGGTCVRVSSHDEMKPTRGQLPELRNRQGPRRSPEEQGAGILGNGRCNRSMALTGFALFVMAITRRGARCPNLHDHRIHGWRRSWQAASRNWSSESRLPSELQLSLLARSAAPVLSPRSRSSRRKPSPTDLKPRFRKRTSGSVIVRSSGAIFSMDRASDSDDGRFRTVKGPALPSESTERFSLRQPPHRARSAPIHSRNDSAPHSSCPDGSRSRGAPIGEGSSAAAERGKPWIPGA